MIVKTPDYKKSIYTLKKAIDSRRLSKKDNLKARNIIAGLRLEQDMAYFLDIEFEKYDNIIVLNDLKVEFNGKPAQIDHLVLTCYSAYFIESKSVAGSLAVNKHDEWTRWYGNKPVNTKSPLLQSKRHETILFDLLHDNVDIFLGKILGMQKKLGSYTAHHYVAVSTNCNITGDGREKHRESLKKADQITSTIRNFHKKHAKGMIGTLLATKANDDEFKTMSSKELHAMGEFLINNDISEDDPLKSFNLTYTPPPVKAYNSSIPRSSKANNVKETATDYGVRMQTSKCPKCAEKMEILWGARYKNYYWKCQSCGNNVSTQEKCPQCQTRLKIKKKKNEFFVYCENCNIEGLYHDNSR